MQTRRKNRNYYKQLGDFRQELRETVPRDVLRELHRPVAWRHFAILLRQIVLLALAITLAVMFDAIWIWLPCAIAIGFIIFDFTVLLHEVIHHAVFDKRRPFWEKCLGWLYAIPSGISKTQFTRWHLDHHDELGSWTDDPKRAHLTPKLVKRWYKFLYMTPALFPIYFRAAARETATYPPEMQKQIQFERRITLFTHVSIMAALIYFAGPWIFLKVYAVPYFLVFPIAFTINRMGQHYNIKPNDVAQWSTLMKGSYFWDKIYLYSNYHLEHHYFPAVPCYNLPILQRYLHPLYERHHMQYQSYGKVLYGWFVENRDPHTDWNTSDPSNQAIDSPVGETLFP